MPVVALSGFMGSGKSTVGEGVAESLGWRFVDLDRVVEQGSGLPARQIFDEQGEAAFRSREVEALREVLDEPAEPGLVVALGGGTVTVPEAVRLLSGRAPVVHLDVPVAEAWQRVSGDDERPLARSLDEFAALARRRELVYRETADAVVHVGGRTLADVIGETAAVIMALPHSARSRSVGDGLGHAGPSVPGWTSDGGGDLWRIELQGTSRGSSIVGGQGALVELASASAEAAARGLRGFVITDTTVLDEGVAAPVLAELAPGFLGADPLTVAAGEASKDASTASLCWGWLADRGARRDDIVIALGGGVVGDLAGFVAATYQRGVCLWQVPTTLLAQVDSSVGGKVALDLPQGKNLVGAFYQPELVVIDPTSLRSLPGVELRAGLGEVVKYSLLDEGDMLVSLESAVPWVLACAPPVIGEVVRRCVSYKAAVVAEDETDRGRRAVLNLGHTVAHALESVMGYGALSHGAAVGLGLLVALAVSEEEVALEPGLRGRVRRLLIRLGLPVAIDLPPVDDLLAAAGRDKKVSAAGSGFVCLEALGRPVWGVPVDADRLAAGLEVIRR